MRAGRETTGEISYQNKTGNAAEKISIRLALD